jgi:hypothetical protein
VLVVACNYVQTHDHSPGGFAMLYLTAALIVAALIYLLFAMIRPEMF